MDQLLVERYALLQLEEALNAIPNHEKLDYLEAVRRAPDLVTSESDPMRFLRFTNYNARAAAQVLIKYWKQRCRIFGDDAFLPMLLTGNGALSEEVIECFIMGQSMVLPPDKYGRTVRCSDQSRLIEKRPEIRRKSAFFNAQLVMEQPGSQTKGLVLLVPIYQLNSFDSTSVENINVLLNCFPIKMHSWHVTHTRDGENNFMQDLQAHGLDRSGVPETLGGDWSYERDFTQWLHKRGLRDLEIQRSMSRTRAKRVGLTSKQLEKALDSSANEQVRCKERSDGTMLFIQNWKHAVKKALSTLPPEETAAYRTALEKAPSEVNKQEVGADLFLRTEYFNARLAAKRLARYWQLRADTFGPKQFLPLHQTGEGALGRKEINVLREGSICLLPHDAEEHPVVSIEPSHVLDGKKSLQEGRDRCLFYMFSLLTENANAQSDGCVALLRLTDPQASSYVDIGLVESLAHALPLRMKAIHLLTNGDAFPDTIKEKVSFAQSVHVHRADNGLQLGALLEPFGLKKSGLPKSLHGCWGQEKFHQWLEIRTRMEFQIQQVIGVDVFSFPAIRMYTLLPKEEKEKYHRRMNVIHCRRKRDRAKLLVRTLEEDSLQLKETRALVEQENRRLSGLVASAKRFISFLEQEKAIEQEEHKESSVPEDDTSHLSQDLSQERSTPSLQMDKAYDHKNKRGHDQLQITSSVKRKKPSEVAQVFLPDQDERQRLYRRLAEEAQARFSRERDVV